MELVADPIDRRLLDEWQRDFPVTERPFAVLARATGRSEDDVLTRLCAMRRFGRITRVGATCAPNTLSASTLAAIAAPLEEVEKVVAIINDEPGVNHSYERDDHWNLWFVATGPDREHVAEALARIERRSGRKVLDLQMVRSFSVDLGFRMTGTSVPVTPSEPKPMDKNAIRPGDHDLMHALTQGLPLVPAPYAALADQLGRSEADVRDRIETLAAAGILTRLGVIVRHRALGWRSNAMVVWDIGHDAITTAGPELAALPGVTLCYERRPVERIWPYRLYNMIHSRSHAGALAVADAAAELPTLRGVPHKMLFSNRCFRQTGAMITAPKEATA
ncbi:MAG: Lrp/AsnC family transcriptional regulator [Rhodobacteraceae bacterium]|nr:Lrp/AsnC family transcriptional regulator [Paracoccaceae bacterium]